MTIIKRADLGRPLTWNELDDNFQQVDDLTAAASAAVSSAAASATAAAGSATNSLNSANSAAGSADDAAASATVAINALMNSTFEPSSFDFTTGGTLDTTDRNKAVYNPADNNWYSWSGTLPKIVSAGEDPTADTSWKPRTDQLLRQELASNVTPGADLVSLKNGKVTDAIYYVTPDMFGAVGDGVTDDYQAIQLMFDSIPPFSVVQLRSGSVYYNAFANDGAWRDLKSRAMWRITKPVTIIGNGALFTRRQPKWNDSNAKNNSNSGPGYTDQDTAVLYLDNVDYLNIENLRIDGNNPVGAIKNTAGQDTGSTGYAQCECRDFGIYVEGGSRIRMTGVDIKNCCFNILGFGVNDIKIEGRLYQSGQAWKMISSDLALGAGVKLMNCTKFKLDIVGHHNTNATAEIEPNNIDGDIDIRSNDDYANGMVIYDSNFIDYKAKITDVKSGSGVQIIHGNSGQPTKNITGKMYVGGASWCGLQIRMTGNAMFDMKDIAIDYVGENCSLADYWADQTPAIATGKKMRNINVNVLSDGWSTVDGGPKISGYSVRISGAVGGKTTGKIRNTNIGFLCDNGNDASDPHYARLDLTESVSIPYSVGANNYVDWFGTVTANQMMLMSRAPKLMMARASVSAGEQDYTEIYMRSPLIRFANLPIDPASKSPFQIYSHQTVENSVNTYTLRINY